MQLNSNFQDPIELHIRTYRSLLKSAGEIRISKLKDSHENMESILHEKAGDKKIDTSAFIYSLLRLPDITSNVKEVILGQSESVFRKHGFAEVEKWQPVSAPGRRRKIFYDGKETLAVYIASVTDVDDIVTLLTAFQTEWNKMHRLLKDSKNVRADAARILGHDDSEKIRNIWGDDYHKFLTAIKYRKVDFNLKLLSGSYVEYAKSTQFWLQNIKNTLPSLQLQRRPYYFVSSNTHSLVNLVTGFALANEKRLNDFLDKSKDSVLLSIRDKIYSRGTKFSRIYFLNYLMKKMVKKDVDFSSSKDAYEKSHGIMNVPSSHYLDIDAQIIEVNRLSGEFSGLYGCNGKILAKSNAIIFNIDYPLGWAAYQIITELGQNLDDLRGVYIMGKAAGLSGHIGDIMLPETVYDTHTKNTFAIKNTFKSKDLEEIFTGGLVLEKQKSVSVKGTFFENRLLLDEWFKNGFTDVEMESGPFLNGLYEFLYYNRYIENQFINISDPYFDLGIAHYISDTPNSKAKNLGVRNLSFEGVEPTYAISLMILKKIAGKETEILGK